MDLSLKEIQTIELNILDAIHSLCTENNITYYLAYGSMLGAVRHQGFIPWDDDIDLVMPRKDYERFLDLAPSCLPGHLKLKHSDNTDPY